MKHSPLIRPAKLGRLALLLVALGLSVMMETADAQSRTTVTTPSVPDGSAKVTHGIDDQELIRWLRSQPGFPKGLGVRSDIEIKATAARAKLAPCQQTEAFLAPGSRLWGRVNIGIRCTQGARWVHWQPATLRISGPALVARHALSAGTQPQSEDFDIQTIDWTALPVAPAGIDTALAGQELQRPMAAGQPLRADHLRARPSIRSGELIAAIAEGPGFRIATDAVALANASEGQTLRVRTTSGKVLTGQVEGKTVKIFR